jgi:RNA-splicing ligase RtcB
MVDIEMGMTIVRGKYCTAVCYCALDELAAKQIEEVCDREENTGNRIRIMPDAHAGKGCVIGTTMTIKDKVVPGMVGVDIGCGVLTSALAEKQIDFRQLDKVIRENVPSGRNIQEKVDDGVRFRLQELTELRCSKHVNIERAILSAGTLGGGNHFIEVDENSKHELFLVIHTGSRHLGLEVANYYQDKAIKSNREADYVDIGDMIEQLKKEGKHKHIEKAIKIAQKHNKDNEAAPDELAYVYGQDFEDYIHDMNIVQHYAALNRGYILWTIVKELGLGVSYSFDTVHNYIDTEHMILRKGAVSARAEEKILIPLNMRDGALICIGKGNDQWNQSAPHGAGRKMSRKKATAGLSMEEYKKEMEGVYSTCISKETLDESPMAYKPKEEVMKFLYETVEVVDTIKPLYNFKAGE